MIISLKHTFVRFALVGVVNTFVGLGVIFIAWHFFGFSDLAANLLGYAVGFLCSYCLNRLWTFAERSSLRRSFWRFALVCAVAYVANLLVLFGMRELMGPEGFLPHIAGSVAYTIIGYLGSRFFAFSQTQGSRLADASPPI